jgi:hypothetical protein
MRYLLIFLIGCSQDYNLSLSDENFIAPYDTHIPIGDDAIYYNQEVVYQTEEIHNLDVLLVLDKSCSMQDDMPRVSAGVVNLVNDIQGRLDWWTLTLINMSPSNYGPSGPYNPDNYSPIDIELAAQLLPYGGWEMGLASTYRFLFDRPNAMNKDSNLLVFMISDEEDSSGIQAQTLKDWLDEFKAPTAKADVIAITTLIDFDSDEDGIDDESTCGGNDIGNKYIELSELYGNDPINLCDDDWEHWFDSYSHLTNDLRDRWVLEHEPIDNSLSVIVNSIESESGWVLEGKMVIFGSPPEIGSEIEFTYSYKS